MAEVVPFSIYFAFDVPGANADEETSMNMLSPF
jgi:hypothetical protein